MTERVDVLRRKLRYLCRRRATQELELILTRFWDTHGDKLNEGDLLELEAVLSLDDMDLLAMCLGQKPFPASFRQDLTRRLLPAPLARS
jgi:antitoxin CptB